MALRTINGIDELRTLVGQEISTSDWIEVSQKMIDTFAEVTGDHQWIHVDVERCKRESPFQAPIAHGFLTLSLITRMLSESVSIEGEKKMGINYGLNRVRFANPVRAGSRVRGRIGVKSVEDFAAGVQTTWQVKVELDGDEKPALLAEWISRWYT